MDISIFYYKVQTTSSEGSVSTPFFQEPFDENSFKPLLSLSLYIYVPKSIYEQVMVWNDNVTFMQHFY